MPDIFGVIEIIFFTAAFVFAFLAAFRSSTPPEKHKLRVHKLQDHPYPAGNRRRLFILAAAVSFAIACSPALFLPGGSRDPSLPPMPPPGEREILNNVAFWIWLTASVGYWTVSFRQRKKKPVQTMPQVRDFGFRLRGGLLVLLLGYITAVQVIKRLPLPPPAPPQPLPAARSAP